MEKRIAREGLFEEIRLVFLGQTDRQTDRQLKF